MCFLHVQSWMIILFLYLLDQNVYLLGQEQNIRELLLVSKEILVSSLAWNYVTDWIYFGRTQHQLVVRKATQNIQKHFNLWLFVALSDWLLSTWKDKKRRERLTYPKLFSLISKICILTFCRSIYVKLVGFFFPFSCCFPLLLS